MRITWSSIDKTPLEDWLLYFAPIDPAHVERVRDLICNARQYTGASLETLRTSFDALDAAWAREYRAIDHCFGPIGRGSRRGATAPTLSEWELMWLRTADLADRGLLAWSREIEELTLVPRDKLSIVAGIAVCGYPDDAARLAREAIADASPHSIDRVWLSWIAGESVAPGDLAASAAISWLERGEPLVAAFHERWQEVLDTLPKKANQAGDKPVSSPDKLLAQLAHYWLGKLDAKVLRTSFGKAFGWSYHPHSSFELSAKVPFAYLWGRCFAKTATAAQLVVEIGNHVAHLKVPPSRTFRVPTTICAMLGQLRALAASTDRVTSHLMSSGVEVVSSEERPSPNDSTSFAGL